MRLYGKQVFNHSKIAGLLELPLEQLWAYPLTLALHAASLSMQFSEKCQVFFLSRRGANK